jgi:hypothetical protein
MNERQSVGPISAVASAVGDEFAKHSTLPPDKKNANRAYWGGLICGTCSYLALVLAPEASSFGDEWKLGFAAVFAWGVLLLVIGWRGSRGARDVLGAIFAIAIPAIGFIAAANYAPPDMLQATYVRAFCCGIIAANAIRFLICVRGVGGNARKLVVNDINQGEWKW